ncbi:MAG TPA: hypothetical protein VN519_06885 [Bryobacteraceae bacterium]|nr:hypothetical protein [Bryobacteraceae bacterium]
MNPSDRDLIAALHANTAAFQENTAATKAQTTGHAELKGSIDDLTATVTDLRVDMAAVKGRVDVIESGERRRFAFFIAILGPFGGWLAAWLANHGFHPHPNPPGR